MNPRLSILVGAIFVVVGGVYYGAPAAFHLVSRNALLRRRHDPSFHDGELGSRFAELPLMS